MKPRTKFITLLKAKEVAEYEAARYAREISEVLEGRRVKLNKLLQQKAELEQKISLLRGASSRTAVQAGALDRVTSIARYLPRVRDSISYLEGAIKMQGVEVAKAEERLKLAENDLIEARVERKKVQNLIENNDARAQLVQDAWEESTTDEMAAHASSARKPI